MKTDLRIISGILYKRRREREERTKELINKVMEHLEEENMTTQSFQEVLEEEGRLRQKDLRQHQMYQDEDLNYTGNR